MARVLADGDFAVEAILPLKEAVETALQSLAGLLGEPNGGEIPLGLIESRLVRENLVPAETISLVAQLRESDSIGGEDRARSLLDQGDMLFQHTAEAFDRKTLGSDHAEVLFHSEQAVV